MELRLLRYFLAVVDEGSVTRAAANVRVAQPSISRQIRQLEASLDAELFERRGGRLQLSAAGRVFLPMARDLVARAEVAANVVRGLAATNQMSLALVAPETTVADVIAPFLAKRGPDAPSLSIREALPSEVFADIQMGGGDLGISSGTPPSGLARRPIVRFAIWAYVRPEDPLARHRRISLEVLTEQPLIVLGQGHGTRRLFDDAVSQAGLSYEAVVETNVPQVAQAFAAAGRGVAIVTDDRRYGLRPLAIDTPNGPLRITLYAAWDETHYAAAAIEHLVDELTAFAAERYGGDSRP